MNTTVLESPFNKVVGLKAFTSKSSSTTGKPFLKKLVNYTIKEETVVGNIFFPAPFLEKSKFFINFFKYQNVSEFATPALFFTFYLPLCLRVVYLFGGFRNKFLNFCSIMCIF